MKKKTAGPSIKKPNSGFLSGIDKSERFLSNIFSSIPDGISVSDTSMRVMWVNDAMKKWYSHAMPIVGRKCFEVYHGRKRYCDVCPVRKTFRTGKMAFEVVPRTGPGKKVIGWMDLYSFPLKDKKTGHMTGVIEYVRDITERKRAEDELKASEKRYKTLVENASDFIFTVDGDGVIWSVNAAGTVFLGKRVKDVVGKKINSLFPSKNVREFIGEIRKVIETNSTRANIERIIQFRGREVILSTSLSPIKGDGERVSVVLGIARDITSRKEAEKKLKLYSGNLEQMVAERTRELDRVRADLFAAAKLSAMGRMGAGIAHQLNSPICGGMLLTDAFMAMEGRSPKEMELLKKLRNVFESMQNVIQCMLSIAGVRTGGQPHDFISVNGVLKNILSLASVDIKKQKIFVETDFDATIPAIDVGVGELDQAFLNIINNAVDAMKHGGRLCVKTVRNKGVVEVFVSDTGEGISKENLNRLFEPFFTTKIDKHGLGLGLSIAKQIIDKYQGTISVKSEPNRGTEIVIRLPAGK